MVYCSPIVVAHRVNFLNSCLLFVVRQCSMRIALLILLVSTLLMAGCATEERQPTTSTSELDQSFLRYTGTNVLFQIMSGGSYLTKEHENNRVPGAPKGTHGTMQVLDLYVQGSKGSVTDASPMPKLTFPFSWTYLFIPTGDEGFTNHYTIVRLTNDSPWHLVRAWRTGPSGQTVKEWLINQ